MARPSNFLCTGCSRQYALDTRDWLCVCGGIFDLEPWPTFVPAAIDKTGRGLRRYQRLLPLDPHWEPIALGEGSTPLIDVEWEGRKILFKLESYGPTGSFKDRGAATLVTALHGMGVTHVVEDSSGNAGASLAACAARAGIACEVFVPSMAFGSKLSQIRFYGAKVVEIQGKREYAALAAWAAAAHGAYYASHVYNPFFLAGIETLAYELWEDQGQRAAGTVVVPVGNGTLLLGLYRGFLRLHKSGAIGRIPRLIAVQAAACAPLLADSRPSLADSALASYRDTSAQGIAIRQPVRKSQILDAVRSTGGTVVTVTEEQIGTAHRLLGERGFHVEPTSAASVAALAGLYAGLADGDEVVVPLTGHGLKAATWGAE